MKKRNSIKSRDCKNGKNKIKWKARKNNKSCEEIGYEVFGNRSIDDS